MDTFIGLDILRGRSMILSRLYCWVKEYISFIWVCRVDGVCDLIGDIDMGKWIGEGVWGVLMEMWCPMIIGWLGWLVRSLVSPTSRSRSAGRQCSHRPQRIGCGGH